MVKLPTAAGSFLFIGNNLGLDLVNTRLRDVLGEEVDFLSTTESLVAWIEASGKFVDPAFAKIRAGARQEALLSKAHSKVLQLRGELAELFALVAQGRPFVSRAAPLLNRYVQPVQSYRSVVVRDDRLEAISKISAETDVISALVGVIASSTLDLLANASATDIKKCANPMCTVFFYDTTKNHRRQWCSMNVCGNRAKVSRFRERHT